MPVWILKERCLIAKIKTKLMSTVFRKYEKKQRSKFIKTGEVNRNRLIN